MSRYYRITDATVIDLDPADVAALAQSKRDTLRPYTVDAQPTPTAQQFVVAGPVVIDATSARQTWELRAKSPEQLQAEQFAATQQAALDQARTVFKQLRDGSGTAAERLTRVERVCAHYLREKFGGEPA